MRKNSETQRFPNSALLFRFCLRVLEARKPGGKVHDQEVGNILQYNPSDTSHWKRGKKAVRSVYALEALARQLDVDVELIQDVADGVVDLDEAWFEFSEAEEERRHTRELSPELWMKRRERQELFNEVASKLLGQAKVTSVPVYLPELLTVLTFIQVAQGDVTDRLARSSRIKPGQYSIRYRKGELRAHTRAALAREIARVILHSEREQFGIPPKAEDLAFFEMLDLSNALLVPRDALREEMQKVPNRSNAVRTLSEVFWVPKPMIRSRLTSLILEAASFDILTAAPVHVRSVSPLADETLENDLSEDDSTAVSAGSEGLTLV